MKATRFIPNFLFYFFLNIHSNFFLLYIKFFVKSCDLRDFLKETPNRQDTWLGVRLDLTFAYFQSS